MINEKIMVCIPTEEYRELVQAKRDADVLKGLLRKKQNDYEGIRFEDIELLCKVFQVEERGEDA